MYLYWELPFNAINTRLWYHFQFLGLNYIYINSKVFYLSFQRIKTYSAESQHDNRSASVNRCKTFGGDSNKTPCSW
jgi:hypothetical protein